jgi:hypothetical protein
MDEDLTMLIIICCLIFLLGFTIWLNQPNDKVLVADITKVAVSGYIGFLSGKNRTN